MVSIDKITDMKEKIERTCADFIWIQKDSIVFVCFDSVKYQIRLIDWKRFINSLLELQCFNFKKTHMCFVLMLSVKKLFLQTKYVGGVCHCVAKYFYSMSFIHSIYNEILTWNNFCADNKFDNLLKWRRVFVWLVFWYRLYVSCLFCLLVVFLFSISKIDEEIRIRLWPSYLEITYWT